MSQGESCTSSAHLGLFRKVENGGEQATAGRGADQAGWPQPLELAPRAAAQAEPQLAVLSSGTGAGTGLSCLRSPLEMGLAQVLTLSVRSLCYAVVVA